MLPERSQTRYLADWQAGIRRRVSTRALPIGGGKGFPVDPAARHAWIANAAVTTGLVADRLDELLGRYGTSAQDIASHDSIWSDADRLPDKRNVSLNEIDWIARREMTARLGDIVKRRKTLALTENIARGDIGVVASVASEAWGWTAAQKSKEVRKLIAELSASHVRMRRQSRG